MAKFNICLAACGLLAATTLPALALDDCLDANVGIVDLVAPFDANTLSYYDGQVALHLIDTMEPVCCSIGLAIIQPAEDAPEGYAECVAITGYRGLDFAAMKVSSDDKGTYLAIPTQNNDDEGNPKPGKTLHLKIDATTYRVSIEP
jgi:hypothetical protein